MRPSSLAGTALGCVALWLAACGDEQAPSTPVVSFAQSVEPIFMTHCIACHDQPPSPPSAKPMDLVPANAYVNIVNVPAAETDTSTLLDRIEPGDPEASYLIHKIQGTQTASSVRGRGVRMPAGCPTSRPCLSAEEIQLIRQWVVEGAPNN